MAEDASDRRALIRDRAVAVDDGDHVAAVLHEGAEPLFAPIELGGALLHPQLEVGGQRQVLEQRGDLTDHGEHEQRQRIPSEEATEPIAERQSQRPRSDREHDWRIGHEHRESIGHIVVRALRAPSRSLARPRQRRWPRTRRTSRCR